MTIDTRTCLACGKTGGIFDEPEGPTCGACGALVVDAEAAHARGVAEGRRLALEEAAAVLDTEADVDLRDAGVRVATSPQLAADMRVRAQTIRVCATRIRALVKS